LTRAFYRGHPIVYIDGRWVYQDTGEPTTTVRPCVACGLVFEGHDPCLGTLPGVSNACCGHGVPSEAYIQFENGVTIHGFQTY
jgi:hypothetical protein